ncbi:MULTISPECIES: hypothetical protein [unclassified Streptomyces]|uniref:hypothetical protein n=2 Tax=Streptomyces TaxID=1883 RepID=UPI0034018966
MRIRRLAAAGVAVAGLVVFAPTTASALWSYNGDDYSYDHNSRNNITTCDKESDQTGVKAVYEYGLGARDEVKDGDGNNGVCAGEGTPGPLLINGHQTCETPHFWPDSCGNWKRY